MGLLRPLLLRLLLLWVLVRLLWLALLRHLLLRLLLLWVLVRLLWLALLRPLLLRLLLLWVLVRLLWLGLLRPLLLRLLLLCGLLLRYLLRVLVGDGLTGCHGQRDPWLLEYDLDHPPVGKGDGVGDLGPCGLGRLLDMLLGIATGVPGEVVDLEHLLLGPDLYNGAHCLFTAVHVNDILQVDGAQLSR